MATPHISRHTSVSTAALALNIRIVDGHASFIASSQLFSGVPFSDCLRIAQHARWRVSNRGEVLFQSGEAIHRVSLIESGLVKLTQLSPDGSEVILWLRGRGHSIGIPNNPTHSSHTCSGSPLFLCRTMSWGWFWLDQLPSARQIRANVSNIICGQLSEIQERFREIATEKVSIRVALMLVRILTQVGEPAIGGTEVHLSREALAQLTGTTLFTVSRLISRWSDQGLVEARREAIIVRDPAQLLLCCRDFAEHSMRPLDPKPLHPLT